MTSLDLLELLGREFSHLDSGLVVLAEKLKVRPTLEDVTALLQMVKFVVTDDFHHLSKGARLEIGQHLKLWHERNVRFVIIGIASSAAELFGADTELGIRNDPFELKTQDEEFVRALIQSGEKALNISFSDPLENEIVGLQRGSIHCPCNL